MKFINLEKEIKEQFDSNTVSIEVKKILEKNDFYNSFSKNNCNDVLEIENDKELVKFTKLTFNLVKNTKLSYKELYIDDKKTDMTFFKGLKKALFGITTHPIKSTNPLNYNQNIFIRTINDKNSYGITSHCIDENTQEVAFSENASYLGFKNIISTEFFYQNKKTTFIELIAKQCDVVTTAISKNCLINEEQLQELIDCSQEAINGNMEYAQGTQVYQPLLCGSYELVTPVPSAKMQRTLNRGFRSFKRINLNKIFLKNDFKDRKTLVNISVFDSSKLKDMKNSLKNRDFSKLPHIIFNALEELVYCKNNDILSEEKIENLDNLEKRIINKIFNTEDILILSNKLFKIFKSKYLENKFELQGIICEEVEKEFEKNIIMILKKEHLIHSFLSEDVLIIGGSQPQNISDLNSRMIGHNKHLKVDLSFLNKKTQNLSEKLTFKKSLLKYTDFNNYKILFSKTIRFEYKKHYNDALFDWIYNVCNELINIKDNFNEYKDLNYSQLNVLEKSFIERNMSISQKENFNDLIINRFIEMLNKNNIGLEAVTLEKVKKETSNILKELF